MRLIWVTKGPPEAAREILKATASTVYDGTVAQDAS